MKSYFAGATPLILAHRGFAVAARENTLAAFAAALEAGATHIESDIQVTADGIAVLFHDDDLEREFGTKGKVSHRTLAELRALTSERDQIPTLEEAIRAFPKAKFNFDIKSEGAVLPTVRALAEAEDCTRFLVSSFSYRRRVAALNELRKRGKDVATSADARTLLLLRLLFALGLKPWFARVAKSVDALQIPVRLGPIRFDRQRFVAWARDCSIEIHFWTINDPEEMLRLTRLGATGIVTDRSDLAATVWE